jgi:long-chain fatty acid transport protein
MKKLLICAAVAATLAPSAWATNGMNMESYGPIATGMGGASMAYDHGDAAMMNNPATLGFMASGTSRLDLAIGGLHPDVSSQGQDSGGTAYFMPAIGYVRKDGNLAYGVGMMAQGGMGTDYSNGSMFGGVTSFGVGPDAASRAAGGALRNMSEVGVGRVIFPLAVNVNENFTIGGSVDFVWAGMDIKWMVDGAHFGNMMAGQTQVFGKVGNNMITAMQGFMTPGSCGVGVPCMTGLSWGYFDFEKGGTMQQQATGTGFAGNLGFTWKASDRLTIGGIYHAKTDLSDLSTGDTGATLTMNATVTGNGGATYANTNIPVVGKITVKNFQWPETYGLGLSYQANDQWMIAADYKRINWADVMKDFNMTFVASATQSGPWAPGFANKVMDLQYFQNWGNQNVFMIGAAYKYSAPLTLRFGANIANNPIPDAYVTPLFPAIETNHVMGGFGYAMDKQSSVDFAFTYAPKVTVTNNWSAVGGSNQTISHSQTNWQLMYSKRF